MTGWRDWASCLGMDTSVFFMPDTEGMTLLEVSAVKATFQGQQKHVARMCEACPVLSECRLLSLAEADGMFAAVGTKYRRKLRAQITGTTGDDTIHELRARVSAALDDIDNGVPWSRALERAGIPDLPFFHEFDIKKQTQKGAAA